MKISRSDTERRNTDGSYDSICLTCFLTSSHAATGKELAQQDKAHVCWRSLLPQHGYANLAQPMRQHTQPPA